MCSSCLQNAKDPFPLAKTEEKEPTCHISEHWRLAEGSHRQAISSKQGAKLAATARRCPVTARRFVIGAPGWRLTGGLFRLALASCRQALLVDIFLLLLAIPGHSLIWIFGQSFPSTKRTQKNGD